MNVRGTKIQRNVVWSRKFVFITNHGNSRKEMTLILLNVWLSYPIFDYLECKSNFKGRGSRSDRCNNVKSSFNRLFPIAKINHYHGHERVYEIAGVQQSVKIWKKKWSRLTRALNSVTFSPEVRCKGNDRAYTPTASGDKRVGNQPKPAKAIRRQPKRKLRFGFLPIPPVAQPFFPTSDIYIILHRDPFFALLNTHACTAPVTRVRYTFFSSETRLKCAESSLEQPVSDFVIFWPREFSRFS